MPKAPPESGIMLTSKDEFKQYLNCSDEILMQKYVPLGLPGAVINGRWSGSTARIDQWWNELHAQPIMRTLKNPIRVGNGEDFE
jgi:hypothetical protein